MVEPTDYNLISLDSLMREPHVDVSWLWEYCLPMAGISILAAKPKAGKSTMARCLMACVATGEPFLGRQVHRGRVVYLALEERRDMVASHFAKLNVPGNNIFIIFTMPTPDALAEIEALIGTLRPALLVIDPMIRAFRIGDTNDYSEVSRALEPIGSMARRLGPHIMLVHQLGKRQSVHGDAILGSTALFGSVDSALLVDLDRQRRLFYSLQRYGTAFEETTPAFSTDTGWVTLGTALDGAGALGVSILEALPENDWWNRARIITMVRGKHRDLFHALELLVDAGLVLRTGKGAPGDAFLYQKVSLPDSRTGVDPASEEEESGGERLPGL